MWKLRNLKISATYCNLESEILNARRLFNTNKEKSLKFKNFDTPLKWDGRVCRKKLLKLANLDNFEIIYESIGTLKAWLKTHTRPVLGFRIFFYWGQQFYLNSLFEEHLSSSCLVLSWSLSRLRRWPWRACDRWWKSQCGERAQCTGGSIS